MTMYGKTAATVHDYACKYCGKKSTYAMIAQVHDKYCDSMLVQCPYKCSVTIPQKLVKVHIKYQCKNTIVKCKLQNIGCKIEMKREKMAAHEDNDKFHIHMSLNAVVKLQDAYTVLQDTTTKVDLLSRTVAALKVDNDELEVKSQSLTRGESITFAVSNYRTRKLRNEIFLHAPVYTHPNGYRMVIRVEANGHGDGKGTHVSVIEGIVPGNFDASLTWPFIGKVTFTLLNQLEDNNHYTKTLSLVATHNVRAGSMPWGVIYFIPHSALAHDPVKNTQYLKDDTLYFRVSVEVANHKPWLECSTK